VRAFRRRAAGVTALDGWPGERRRRRHGRRRDIVADDRRRRDDMVQHIVYGVKSRLGAHSWLTLGMR